MWQDMGYFEAREPGIGEERVPIVILRLVAIHLVTACCFCSIEIATDHATVTVADKTGAPEGTDSVWCPCKLLNAPALCLLNRRADQRGKLGCLAGRSAHWEALIKYTEKENRWLFSLTWEEEIVE